MIRVLCKLRRHWRGGVPSYVAEALRDKKRQLNHLYTKVVIKKSLLLQKFTLKTLKMQVTLDGNSPTYFTDKEGRPLTR